MRSSPSPSLSPPAPLSDRRRAALRFLVLGLLVGAVALSGCKRRSEDGGDTSVTPPSAVGLPSIPAQQVAGRKQGDRVQVRWKGQCYAARILSVAKGGTYFITYEGYAHSWDETIGESRICK